MYSQPGCNSLQSLPTSSPDPSSRNITSCMPPARHRLHRIPCFSFPPRQWRCAPRWRRCGTRESGMEGGSTAASIPHTRRPRWRWRRGGCWSGSCDLERIRWHRSETGSEPLHDQAGYLGVRRGFRSGGRRGPCERSRLRMERRRRTGRRGSRRRLLDGLFGRAVFVFCFLCLPSWSIVSPVAHPHRLRRRRARVAVMVEAGGEEIDSRLVREGSGCGRGGCGSCGGGSGSSATRRAVRFVRSSW